MFELHTSDLDVCPGRAVLRRQGQFEPKCTTALLRGLIAHEALRLLHLGQTGEGLVGDAARTTMSEMMTEGRELTEATEAALPKTLGEVATMVGNYHRRILPVTEEWAPLGYEIPIAWELSKDVMLSSHLDSLWINQRGECVIWDWKWRKDSPAIADLARHLQLAAYWAGLQCGMVLLPDAPTSWIVEEECDEGVWCRPPILMPTPHIAWIDLPSLKPYARATIAQDENGRAVEYKRGDDRPLGRIIRWCAFAEGRESSIQNILLRRARLVLDEEPIFIPQMGGCAHCDCEPFCPRLDMPIQSDIMSTQE